MIKINAYNKIEAAKKQPQFNKKLKEKIFFLIALLIVISLVIISLFTGVYDIFNKNFGFEMFLITRVPRTVALILSGCAMSVCGLVMQLMTQNRFVEPTTTGTIEWSGLGLIVVYLFWPEANLSLRMGGAILFSFLGTISFLLFLNNLRLKSSLIVPIIGIMLGAMVSAISTFLSLVFNMTQSLEVWFAGSFSPIQRGRYEYLFIIILVVIVIFIIADYFTVIGLGKDVSTNLGVNYKKIILIGTLIVSITVGVVASVIGYLPFLGLIVPNIVSLIKGDNLRENLPWICLFGIGCITFCDILSRTLIAPFEIPVSLILGIIGSIVFTFVLLKSRKVGK